MSEAPGFAVRRILAAFHASTADAGALQGVVEVARRLGAEIEAVFIEDEGLLGLADLPFVRQIGMHGLNARPLARTDTEREMRALAAGVRNRLAEVAGAQGVTWTFQTVRGRVAVDVIAAAARADLLVLGARSRPFGRAVLLEGSVPSLVAKTDCSVLLLQRFERPFGGPVQVLIETDANVERCLPAAAELARRCDCALVAVTTRDAAERVAPKLQAALAALNLPADRIERRMLPLAPDQLGAILGGAQNGTLVLDAASPLLQTEDVWPRLARAPCAFLLVR